MHLLVNTLVVVVSKSHIAHITLEWIMAFMQTHMVTKVDLVAENLKYTVYTHI